jgi:hypothetical protein
MNHKTINIDDYRPDETDPANVATIHNGVTYLYWDDALANLLADIRVGQDGYQNSGVTVQFNLDVYYFKNSIRLARGVNLLGTGCGGQRPGSMLVFLQSDKPGLVILPTLASGVNPSQGHFSIIERLTLAGPRSPQAGNLVNGLVSDQNHGVHLRACAYIRDCNINHFHSDGIYINASTKATETSEDYGNANNFQVNGCYIGGCLGNGLHVDHGSDTSGGLITALICQDNAGWAIWDESTFGNSYLACAAYAEQGAGAYKTRGGTNASLFINCYTEGVASSEVLPPAFILGGNVHYIPTDDDNTLQTSNFLFGNPSSVDNGIGGYSNLAKDVPLAYASLGGSENQAALTLMANLAPALRMPNPDNLSQLIQAGKKENMMDASFVAQQTSPVRLEIEKDGWWRTSSQGQTAFAFSTDKAADGISQFWLPKGFYLGDPTPAGTYKRKFNSSNFDRLIDEYGLPGPHQAKIGDVVFNSHPNLNGNEYEKFAGFICVIDPNTGNHTWAGFGRIELIAGAPQFTGAG